MREVGMFAWMVITSFLIFAAHPPAVSMVVFWLMMQIGMMLGCAACSGSWSSDVAMAASGRSVRS